MDVIFLCFIFFGLAIAHRFCIVRDLFVLFVFRSGTSTYLMFLRACLLILLSIPLLGLEAVLTFGIYLDFGALLMFDESVIFLYVSFFVIAGTCTVIWLEVRILICVDTLFSTSRKLNDFSFFSRSKDYVFHLYLPIMKVFAAL